MIWDGHLAQPYRHPLYLVERGANDVVAHEHFYLSYMGKLTASPPWIDNPYPDMSSIRSLIQVALHFASEADAVILYGVSYETARQRRINMGLSPEGRIVNSHTWPSYEGGHRWWLQYIYPLLHDHFGTGLLVVNGEKPMAENNERVAQFLIDVMGSASD